MPAELDDTTIEVENSDWMTIGQIIYIQFAGWFQVVSKPDSTHATITNLEDSASDAYLDNSPPTTAIPNGAAVSPGGLQGPVGPACESCSPNDALYLIQSDDEDLPGAIPLDELGGPGLLKIAANGYPSMAADGTDYLSPTTGVEVADIGVTVQAHDAALDDFSGLSPGADDLAYFDTSSTMAVTDLTAFGRSLLDDADAAAARATLGVLSRRGMLGFLTAVDLNVPTSDNAVTMLSSRYILREVIVENASVNLTTATAGVFTAAGGSGTIATDQALSALSATTKFKELVLDVVASTDVITAGTLYFRVGTAQGAPATANVFFFGDKLD